MSAELKPNPFSTLRRRPRHPVAQPRLRWAVAADIFAAGPVFVVVTWSAALFRMGNLPPDWTLLLFGAGGVWLGYLADRWCDAVKLSRRGHPLAERHSWVKRKALPVFLAWSTLLGTGALAAVLLLTPGRLLGGCILAASALLYVCLVTALPQRRTPKEILVAVLLTAAITWTAAPPIVPATSWLLSALVLLFSANCLLIGIWDAPYDRATRQRSPREALRQTTWTPRLLTVLSLLLFLTLPAHTGVANGIRVAGILSCVLLLFFSGLVPLPGRLAEARLVLDASLALPLLLVLVDGPDT